MGEPFWWQLVCAAWGNAAERPNGLAPSTLFPFAGRTDRVVYQGGLVILTSHRIIWHSRSESRAFHGHLSLVGNARKSFNLFKPSKWVPALLPA